MTTVVLDVDRAQITRGPDGTVRVEDPRCPLSVQVRVELRGGRPHLAHLAVDTRTPEARISARALSRLPVRQLILLAAARGGTAHPNEALYRSLARPRPRGQRHWDDGHWERVMTVYDWACETGRPGGGWQAVADMWGVSRNPTAYRWVAQARRRVSPADRSAGLIHPNGQ